MTPVMQTKFSDESLGTRGNCMAACVASLLDIPIDGIPSWEDMGDDGSWGDSFMSFLESNGYEYEGMIAPRSSDWKSDVLSLSDGVDTPGATPPFTRMASWFTTRTPVGMDCLKLKRFILSSETLRGCNNVSKIHSGNSRNSSADSCQPRQYGR